MRLPLLSSVILLAACSGGGGSGGLPPSAAVGTPAPAVPAPAGDLGSRAVPGYAIQVRRSGPVQPGQALGLVAILTPEAGMAPPALVEAAS